MVFFRYSNNYEVILAWGKIVYLAAAFSGLSFFFFSIIFPKRDKINIFLKILAVLFIINYLIITDLLLFTDLIIKEVLIIGGINSLIYNYANYYYGLYILLAFVIGFIILLLKQKKYKGHIKMQLLYIIIGCSLSLFIGFSSNFIVTFLGNFKYNWVGPTSTLIMACFIFYSIIIHRFMDIKIVLRNSFVYAFSVITVIWVAMLLQFGLRYVFAQQVINYIALIVGVTIFPFVRDYFFKSANKYFFSSLYDAGEIIRKMSDELSMTLEHDKVFSIICDNLKTAFNSKAIAILTYEEGAGGEKGEGKGKSKSKKDAKEKYEVAYKKGFRWRNKRFFKRNKKLYNKYIKKNKPIVVEEIIDNSKGETREYLKKLKKYGIEILAPLNAEGETLGVIALGSKEASDIYNKEDFSLLEVVSTQGAIAMKNALLYKETLEFNKKLRQGIKEATAQLTEANKKLKILDKQKTEFISIASHQLRTPLTSIKGYSLQLRDERYGKVSEKQKEVIEKIFIANERTVGLVEDLLNVSRIEQGRIEYEFEELDLRDIISKVMQVMSIQAEHRGLYLKFKDHMKSLKQVMIKADRNKLTEVISNLVDNAIKYTKEGGITIHLKLSENKKKVRVEVKDTGIGIKEEDRKKLFRKYGRGKDVGVMHSNGTGLGLYIVKQLTEAHKGKVSVESEGPGQGSSFIIELPLV
jgi:signal transduction histidine kinase